MLHTSLLMQVDDLIDLVDPTNKFEPRASLAEHKQHETEQYLNNLLPSLQQSSLDFSVLSYNILSPKLEEWTGWGSYQSYLSGSDRIWENRRRNLHDRLLGYNHDIICLQECTPENFEQDFGNFLKQNGYNSVKQVAKATKTYTLYFGTTISWKTSKFELEFEESRSRALIVGLNQKEKSNRLLFVVNCHLQGDPARVEDRFFQMRSIVKRIQHHLRKKELLPSDIDILICGDFNSTTLDSIHFLLENGFLDPSFRDSEFPESQVTKKKYVHDLNVRDAYRDVNEELRVSFAGDLEGNGKFKRQCVDFLFASSHLKSVPTLVLKEEFGRERRKELICPCVERGEWSDHLPIGALFMAET